MLFNFITLCKCFLMLYTRKLIIAYPKNFRIFLWKIIRNASYASCIECSIYNLYKYVLHRLWKFLIKYILMETNLDKWNIRIIPNIYYDQKIVLLLEHKTIKEIKIKSDVRPRCILLSNLFNLYSEDVMNTGLSDQLVGIKDMVPQ